MSNTVIQLKYTTTSGNTPSSLESGELAINLADGKLFYKNASDQIDYFENFQGPSGLNGEIQFNDNGNLGTSEIFSYDKVAERLTVPEINLNNISEVGAFSLVEETTEQIALFYFPMSAYESGKFIIQASESSRKQVTEILVIHDGVSAYATEYAVIRTNGNLFNLDVDVDLDNVRILATGNTSNEITYKVAYTLL
jgi:hypothetical protein